MRDIFEMMEDSAESTLYEMTKGLPRGKFRCDCGNIDELGSATPASNNPYSRPICRKCYKEILKSEEG